MDAGARDEQREIPGPGRDSVEPDAVSVAVESIRSGYRLERPNGSWSVMPSATAGGWPYPLPTEPVRDGAVNIQNLANKAQSRLGNQAILALFFSGAFDVNGL